MLKLHIRQSGHHRRRDLRLLLARGLELSLPRHHTGMGPNLDGHPIQATRVPSGCLHLRFQRMDQVRINVEREMHCKRNVFVWQPWRILSTLLHNQLLVLYMQAQKLGV